MFLSASTANSVSWWCYDAYTVRHSKPDGGSVVIQSLQHRSTPASTFCQLSAIWHTSLSSQHICTSGICGRGSDSLELSAGLHKTIAQTLTVSCLHWRHFCLHSTSTERIRGWLFSVWGRAIQVYIYFTLRLHSKRATHFFVNVKLFYLQMPIGKMWIYIIYCLCISLFVCLYGYGFLRRGWN